MFTTEARSRKKVQCFKVQCSMAGSETLDIGHWKIWSLLFLGCLLVLLAGCLGNPYQFGNRSLFPAGIETVYVPVFASVSLRRDLGERLTEAVVKEIERRTPFKVVSDPNADSVLIGRIVGENKHLTFEALTGDPRESEIHLQVRISWTDQRGNPLRKCPPVAVPADCVNIDSATTLVPEVGQSVATAQQKSIQRLAEQIVSLMEAPW